MDCPCHAAPKASGWVDEFNLKFVALNGWWHTEISPLVVKDFIRELLASDRASRLKEVLEKIEGMKKDTGYLGTKALDDLAKALGKQPKKQHDS